MALSARPNTCEPQSTRRRGATHSAFAVRYLRGAFAILSLVACMSALAIAPVKLCVTGIEPANSCCNPALKECRQADPIPSDSGGAEGWDYFASNIGGVLHPTLEAGVAAGIERVRSGNLCTAWETGRTERLESRRWTGQDQVSLEWIISVAGTGPAVPVPPTLPCSIQYNFPSQFAVSGNRQFHCESPLFFHWFLYMNWPGLTPPADAAQWCEKDRALMCPTRGNPVAVCTGMKNDALGLDFSMPGFPMAAMSYLQGGPSMLDRPAADTEGTSWIGPFRQRIEVAPANGTRLARAIRGEGIVVDFKEVSGAFISYDASSRMQLTELLNGAQQRIGWRLRLPNDQEELYDASGALVQLIDMRGSQTWTVTSSAGMPSLLTNHQGRRIQLAHQNGLLNSFTDSAGATTQFSWDARSRLQSVQWPGGASRQYRYQATELINKDALTSVIDEAGVEYAKWDYFSTGMVKSSEHADVTDKHTFAYTLSGYNVSSASVTSPLGMVEQFQVVSSGGMRRAGNITRSCSGCTAVTQLKSYNDGLVASQTDYRGIPTDYTYDNARDLELTRIEARGQDTQPSALRTNERKVETTWHANWRVPTERRTFFCAAPNATAQACSTVSNTRWTLESLTRHAVNARGQITAVCQIDPANATAMAYTCGSATNAPTGVRQTVTDYCDTTDADFNSATCPFEGYVKTTDGPRTDVADITTRIYFGAEHPSCATQPTSCPYRKGDLRYLDNALGQRTEFIAYDGAGRLLRQKDANGVITDLVYHPRGWLLSRTVRSNADGTPNTSDAITRIEYEPYGEVKRVIQPDEVGMEYCRDAAHPIKAVVQTTLASASRCSNGAPTAGSEAIVYTLDAAGNRTKEEVRDSTGATKRLLARQYNTLGELRSLINAPFAANTNLDDPSVKKTTYTYDANSNQDLATDPLGRVGDNDYDPLNRLIQSIQDKDTAAATGEIQATVKYEYDARDNLRKVIDPKNLTTEYVYDGLNNQTQLISPDTGTTSYTYDAAGNRLSQTDARGVVSNYAYDALGRLTAISYPSDTLRNTAFEYDGNQAGCTEDESFAVGRLTRMTDQTGETRLCYDRKGNLRRKVQVIADETLVVEYRYSNADRLIGMTYPSGLIVNYSRDSSGRISMIDLGVGSSPFGVLVREVSYLPFGPIYQIKFGNGQTLTKAWDQNYWPDAVQGSVLDYDFETNEVGNIVHVQSASEGTQNLSYDRLDRLASVRDANNALIEAYTYDATGNRLSQQIGNAPVVNYNYPANSHRLSQVGSNPRTYDSVGNTITGIPTVPNGIPATYDVRNRLAGFFDPDFDMQLGYNARGERVKRDLFRSAVEPESDRYAYDESGQLLSRVRGSLRSSDAVFEEVVWLDNTPVARVRVEDGEVSSVHAIHSDHLNTPRALSIHPAPPPSGQGIQPITPPQPSGTTVWRWALNQSTATGSNAFGAQAANEDPDGNGALVKFDLRFPGQQWDAAVGLHYNYFRDYEPGTGRYVESDPIGLGGGLSTFGYANANALQYIDDLGLDATATLVFPRPMPLPSLAAVCLSNPVSAVGCGAGFGTAIGTVAYPIIEPYLIRPVVDLCFREEADAEDDDDQCEALYQSILQTCAALKGRKKFNCFEAARYSRDQCYQERGRK